MLATGRLLFLSEPVIDPDLLDFVSSVTLERSAEGAESVRPAVVVVEVVEGLLVAAGTPGLPVVDLAADLGAGLGFTAGLTCFPADSFTPTFGRAPPLEGFFAEEAVVAPLSPLAASVFCLAFSPSFSSRSSDLTASFSSNSLIFDS